MNVPIRTQIQAFGVLLLLACGLEAKVRRSIPLDAGISLTEVGLQYLKDRTETILTAKGFSGETYTLLLFPELSEVNLTASDKETADAVDGTLRSVLKHYLTAAKTKTFPLQYGNASEVQVLLEQIYARPALLANKTTGALLKPPVDISVDRRSSAIVATGPLNILNQIHQTIQSLDHRTTQVLIRVLIAEVTLDNETQYGMEWSLNDNSIFGGPGSTQADVDFGSLDPVSYTHLTLPTTPYV